MSYSRIWFLLFLTTFFQAFLKRFSKVSEICWDLKIALQRQLLDFSIQFFLLDFLVVRQNTCSRSSEIDSRYFGAFLDERAF